MNSKLSKTSVAGLLLLLTAIAGPATAQPSQTARGIYLGGAKLGVATEIEVERNGQRQTVPANFEFKTGDRFWIHVTLNQDSYVYVLNRTLTGSPAKVSRGIKLLAEEDKKLSTPPPDTYTMVFPPPNSKPTLVRKGVRTSIPGNSQFFEMDQTQGAEKLIIVASPSPSEIAKWFDPNTGKLAAAPKTNDTSASVLGRLNSELTSMADNTVTEQSRELPYYGGNSSKTAAAPSKGPAPPPVLLPAKQPSATIGVTKSVGKPMLVELTMMHQN